MEHDAATPATASRRVREARDILQSSLRMLNRMKTEAMGRVAALTSGGHAGGDGGEQQLQPLLHDVAVLDASVARVHAVIDQVNASHGEEASAVEALDDSGDATGGAAAPRAASVGAGTGAVSSSSVSSYYPEATTSSSALVVTPRGTRARATTPPSPPPSSSPLAVAHRTAPRRRSPSPGASKLASRVPSTLGGERRETDAASSRPWEVKVSRPAVGVP